MWALNWWREEQTNSVLYRDKTTQVVLEALEEVVVEIPKQNEGLVVLSESFSDSEISPEKEGEITVEISPKGETIILDNKCP